MCMSRDVLVKHCLFAATAAAVHNNKVATLYYTTLMRNEESSFFFFWRVGLSEVSSSIMAFRSRCLIALT